MAKGAVVFNANPRPDANRHGFDAAQRDAIGPVRKKQGISTGSVQFLPRGAIFLCGAA